MTVSNDVKSQQKVILSLNALAFHLNVVDTALMCLDMRSFIVLTRILLEWLTYCIAAVLPAAIFSSLTGCPFCPFSMQMPCDSLFCKQHCIGGLATTLDVCIFHVRACTWDHIVKGELLTRTLFAVAIANMLGSLVIIVAFRGIDGQERATWLDFAFIAPLHIIKAGERPEQNAH